jgi:hypothetical protein
MGELLDRALRLYRRNFLKFIGIIAVVQVPLSILSLLFSIMSLTPADPYGGVSPVALGGVFGNLALGVLNFILVRGIATAALTQAVADEYLGEPIGFLEAYRRIGGKWGSIVGALLAAMLVNIMLVIWLIIPCIGWITGMGILMFFSAVIIPLTSPVIVIEEQSAFDGLRRAWDLTRRRFWRVVGFVALLMLFSLLVVSGPAALVTLFFQFSTDTFVPGSSISPLTAQTVVQSLVSIFMSLLYTPLQLTAMNLLYFDLRVRTEGFDLALLAGEALGELEGAVQLSPPPETKTLVTWEELGHFALLSIGVFALYAVLGGIFAGLSLAFFNGY